MRVENPVPVDQAVFATQLLTKLRGAIVGNTGLNDQVERAKLKNKKVSYVADDGIIYSITPLAQETIRHRIHPGFHLVAKSINPILGPYSTISVKLFERDPQCRASFAPFSLGCIGGEDDPLLDTQEVDDVTLLNPHMTAGDVANDIINRFARAIKPEVTPEIH